MVSRSHCQSFDWKRNNMANQASKREREKRTKDTLLPSLLFFCRTNSYARERETCAATGRECDVGNQSIHVPLVHDWLMHAKKCVDSEIERHERRIREREASKSSLDDLLHEEEPEMKGKGKRR